MCVEGGIPAPENNGMNSYSDVPQKPDQTPQASVENPAAAHPRANHYSRYFLIGLIVALSVLVFPMVKMFIVPLVLAATFVTICYPMYRFFQKALKNNKTLSALVCCAVIVFCALIPAYAAGYLITNEAIDLYSTAESKAVELFQKGEEGALGKIASSRYMRWIRIARIDWRSSVQEGIQNAAKVASTIVNKTSASVLALVVNFLLTLFTMFYLFIDGEAFLKRINHLLPLRQEYKDLMFNRFLQTSRATVKATLILGLIQGTLGGLTLLAFGIKSWLFWGFIMIVLSVIPMLGSGTILIPTGIILILLGNLWQGIGIIFISVAIISNIDNFFRPRIVGKQARVHDLIIFFSTIGGLAAFGLMGFIIGPVIASLFVTLIDIYGTEFREYLDTGHEGG